MELHDEQALEPAGPPVDPALMRPAGLLAKLVSAVRPEFRVDVFVVDSAGVSEALCKSSSGKTSGITAM